MATIQVTAENLQSTIESKEIVLLDFWAAWCPPCRRFGPIFEGASEKHPDLAFGKVDTEAEQALAADLGISSIPTLMIFRDRVLVYSRPGALPERVLEDLIAQVRALDMEKVRRQLARERQAPPERTAEG